MHPHIAPNLLRRISAFTLIASLMTALLSASAAERPKAGPEHKRLATYAGDWTYEGSYHASPFGPAGKFKGKESNKLVLNGFRLEVRWSEIVDGGVENEGLFVVGYDAEKKAYVDHGFVNDGSYSSSTMTVDGRVWTAYGFQTDPAGKPQKVRIIRNVSSDGNSIHIVASFSDDDGKSWKPWWEQTNQRKKRKKNP